MLFMSDFGLKKLSMTIRNPRFIRTSSCNRRGFTLVEVLISAVILAVGLVVIFEAFLSSLDIVNLVDNRLNAQWFLNEKMQQLQSNLDRQSGMFIPMKQSGAVEIANKEFDWQLDMELVDVYQELYKVTAKMNWAEGSKQRMIKRQVMVKSYFGNANPWKAYSK